MQRVEDTLAIPRRLGGSQLLDTAVSYAQERHWEVLPGAWLETGRGRTALFVCLAGVPGPRRPPDQAGLGDAGERQRFGGAADVDEAASVRRCCCPRGAPSTCWRCRRAPDSTRWPGPSGWRCSSVRWSPRPPAAWRSSCCPALCAKVPGSLGGLGWPQGALDLTVRGEGDWVVAPPTRMGAGGRAQWARRPTAANRWLPDVEEVLSPLAYACGRGGGSGPHHALSPAPAPAPLQPSGAAVMRTGLHPRPVT